MLNAFLSFLTYEKKLSVHTIKAYQFDLVQYAEFCENNEITNLLSADHKLIRQWIIYLIDLGLSVVTIHRKASSIKAFYRFAKRQGKISINPTQNLILPKKNQQIPSFLKEQETEDLFNPDFFDPGFEGQRDRLILLMFYLTGIRRSELVGLSGDDIDFDRQVLQVSGKGNKMRHIPLPGWLLTEISSYQKLKSDFFDRKSTFGQLFLTEKGKKMYPEMVYRIVKKYLTIISTNTKRSPHMLRHTFATQMLNSGADLNAIKELLGHANLAATQVYTHNSFQKLKQAYQQAHPRA